MDKVARLPAADRAALFGETGAARDVANMIIEKDFWVCWTLKRLFGLPSPERGTLVFKGGTSLSKAYGAIRRFSEDIDLSLDRADLGYTGTRAPENPELSQKQTNLLLKELKRDAELHISTTLVPALRTAIEGQLGPPNDVWTLEVDADDPQTVNFHYPVAFDATEYGGMEYITPRVKLELGARGDPWPMEEKAIQPYAAEERPDFFEEPWVTVTVLSAGRTFWEKATALHAEAHRRDAEPTPAHFSRHYYDLAMLLDTKEGKAAARDFDLLAKVARHKDTYFRSGWASYETAQPGTLRLVPSEARRRDLQADYQKMKSMIFDGAPAFDDILAKIDALEKSVNATAAPGPV